MGVMYDFCSHLIEIGNFDEKDMRKKIHVFLKVGKISQEEHDKLVSAIEETKQ